MTAKDALLKLGTIINKNKELFNEAPPLKEGKLKDGVVFKYESESIETAKKVFSTTDKGDVPMADGVYELEDGSTFKVVSGEISEFKKKVEPVKADADYDTCVKDKIAGGMDEEKAKAVCGMIKGEMRNQALVKAKEEIVDLQIELNKIKTDFEKQKKELSEANTKMAASAKLMEDAFKLMEKIIAAPATESGVDRQENKFSKMPDIKEMLKEFRQDLKKHAK